MSSGDPAIRHGDTLSEEADAYLPPGFERHGIESIPDADRTSSIADFLRVCWGGGNSLATAVLGAFPVMLGLSFWQSMAANAAGVCVGALILGPMAVFGPMNGTNNAVSSGAHFGVVGRIVGSFLSLLTAIAFFSISVWSSGDAVVGAAHALFGMHESEKPFAVAYGVFAASVLIVCIYGYGVMLFVNKLAVVASSVLFAVGLIAFWPAFDSHFAGSHLAWGSAPFWPVFVSASLIALSNPISFGAFLGDWSRYLPRRTHKGRLIGATGLAQVLTLLPFTFGALTASIMAQQAPGLPGAGRLHRRITRRLARLVLCAAVPARTPERHVDRHDLPLWYGSGFLERIPAPEPPAGHPVYRAHLLRAHIHRPLLLHIDLLHHDLRVPDRCNHDALDGDHDDRIRHTPRLLPPRGPASLQSRGDWGRLLVQARMECGRHDGLDRLGAVRAPDGRYPRSLCRPARTRERRGSGSVVARRAAAARNSVPVVPRGISRAAGGLRPRGPTTGASHR